MKKHTTELLIGLVMILLIISIIFATQSRKPDYEIRVGIPFDVPVLDKDGTEIEHTRGFDYTMSKPLAKAEVNTVILSFISADSLEVPQIDEALPDAVIQIKVMENRTAYYYLFSLWLNEDSVVFAMGSENGTKYKEVNSPHYAEALTAVIEGQINP